MVFSGLTFLFCFLPAVLALYFTAPRSAKNAVLFLASLLFYAWGEPVYVVLMIFSTILDYTCGRMVERARGPRGRKLWLIFSLTGNLGLLLFFKYADFLLGTLDSVLGTSLPQLALPLPIGISFYTFQTMSYTIDVYRGEVRAQRNIVDFGAYVSLFPQLIAGPIVRYRDIAEQLKKRTHSFDSFGEGARRFVTGLAKKVVLANNIGLLHETIAATPASGLTVVGAWLGMFAFAFQIYFDFSGYSDMAIGLGRMFGFTFPENFAYPYIAASVTDFWRRWHISLGSWFRDYVYIPLGGNRRGMLRHIRNIAVVWLLTGLWHGASLNFLCWGAYYGLLLIFEKYVLRRCLSRAPKPVGHLYTIFAVLIGYVWFSFDNLAAGAAYLGAMFGHCSGMVNDRTLYLFLTNLPLLIVCTVASTPVVPKLRGLVHREPLLTAAQLLSMTAMIVLSVAYLIGGSYNPFLYFRF
ncbi:MAG: MBOAT family protein [Lachnospiraceae bacterium]|nr:MBOAT family protein [Lachnospiraceae bacterium]